MCSHHEIGSRGRFGALALALVLGGCGGTAAIKDSGNGEPGNCAAAMEDLRNIRHWKIAGRIAVTDGKDGGSGRFSWERDPNRYSMKVRAPISGTSWHLHGDGHAAFLDGVEKETLQGTDPAILLEEQLGWHLPMAAVDYWVRGLPVDARAAHYAFDAKCGLAELREQGWRIEYAAWQTVDGRFRLPTKLIAKNPPYEVRLAIAQWDLAD